MVEGDSDIEFLLTRRTETVETHRGQVAFPGGMVAQGDGSAERTALRETEEELGIPPSQIEILGLVDELATPSGFLITPVAGFVHGPLVLRPNPQEVAEVFRVPLSFFADPAHGRRETRIVHGEEREVWFYEFGGRSIWGATAWIIRRILSHLPPS
jgi:8-oxo-dGTP pyrophosphatase MutT (NUDIX family)